MDYTSQDEIFLRKAVECVNSHLSDLDFDAAQFAGEMGMSRSTCNDKLKELTGMTPLAFISSIRLQAAFRMIQEKRKFEYRIWPMQLDLMTLNISVSVSVKSSVFT